MLADAKPLTFSLGEVIPALNSRYLQHQDHQSQASQSLPASSSQDVPSTSSLQPHILQFIIPICPSKLLFLQLPCASRSPPPPPIANPLVLPLVRQHPRSRNNNRPRCPPLRRTSRPPRAWFARRRDHPRFPTPRHRRSGNRTIATLSIVQPTYRHGTAVRAGVDVFAAGFESEDISV